MSRQQSAQALAPEPEHPLRAHDTATRPRNLKGWRTVKELRDELRFPSDKACRAWLAREGIVSVRRGRVILVDGLDVDAALRKRHAANANKRTAAAVVLISDRG